jgi:hypothetical protein
MANASALRRPPHSAPRWIIAVVILVASAIVSDDVDAAPATETKAPVRPLKATPKAPQKTTEKAAPKRTPRRAAKEPTQPLVDPATSFTNLPLLIVYDP